MQFGESSDAVSHRVARNKTYEHHKWERLVVFILTRMIKLRAIGLLQLFILREQLDGTTRDRRRINEARARDDEIDIVAVITGINEILDELYETNLSSLSTKMFGK